MALTVAAAFAVELIRRGNLLEVRWVLIAHVVAGAIATAALLPLAWRLATRGTGSARRFGVAYQLSAALLVVAPAAAAMWIATHPNPDGSDRQSADARRSRCTRRAAALGSPFFPSSAQTNVGGTIPVGLLHGLRTCAASVTRTSTSSGRARRITSRRSTTSSTGSRSSTCSRWSARTPSKWCAGCHDHAVFFNGRFERPIAEQIDTPEAQAGLACTSCHAISQRRQLDGQRRVHDRLSAAAPPGLEPAAGDPRHRPPAHLSRSRAASPHVHEAVHAPRFGRVLRHLPQGAPRRARSTTTAGFAASTTTTTGRPAPSRARARGRSTTRSKPSTCVDCHMPRVPSRDRRPARGRHGALAPLPGGEHRRAVRQPRRRAAEGRPPTSSPRDSCRSTSSPPRRSTKRRSARRWCAAPARRAGGDVVLRGRRRGRADRARR